MGDLGPPPPSMWRGRPLLGLTVGRVRERTSRASATTITATSSSSSSSSHRDGKRATWLDLVDRRATAKSGMTTTQKATKKGRPPPSPPLEEERSAASSCSFCGWMACDAKRLESSAPVTVAAGTMGCGGGEGEVGGSLGATAPPPARTLPASCATMGEKGHAWRRAAVEEEG